MYGTFTHPHMAHHGVPVGLRTGAGTLLAPPGSLIHYVRSTGPLDFDPPELTGRIFSTINAAAAQCRSGAGDIILCLPGHTENVSSANYLSSLVKGTRIVGLGNGTSRPTLHWNTALATILVAVADVSFENMILNLAGDPTATAALTTAAAMTFSAAGCSIRNCNINTGVDVDQIITLGIVTTTGADNFTFDSNFCWNGRFTSGAYVAGAAAEITAAGTFLRLVGADFCKVTNNYIAASLATDTDGVIETLTTASTNMLITDNFLWANGSGNTCALDMGAAVACSGFMDRNLMYVDTNATAETVVWTRNAANLMALGNDNYLINDKNERGLVIGTASA